MNIVFYAAKSGLGDNGGSRTVLLSAKVLRELGHSVSVVATVDRFSYFTHPKCIDRIPHNTDIVIAASWYDVQEMHRVWGGPCAWWMRMWDTHKIPYEEICRLASVQSMIVNAEFMRSKLALAGIESAVIYQGIDFEKWYPAADGSDKKIIGTVRRQNLIGTVRRTQPHYNTAEFDNLSMRGIDGYQFASIVGDGESGMRAFYQSLKYYHAPQVLGGLSNPPMEAALCGACIICPRIPESGLGDYANDATAVMYDRIEDVPDMIIGKNNGARDHAMLRVIIDKIGDRKSNMKKFVKVLEKAL